MHTGDRCLTFAPQESSTTVLSAGGLWKKSLMRAVMLAVVFRAMLRSLFWGEREGGKERKREREGGGEGERGEERERGRERERERERERGGKTKKLYCVRVLVVTIHILIAGDM